MKKVLSLLMIAVVILAVARCIPKPQVDITVTESRENVQLVSLFTPSKVKESEQVSLNSYDDKYAIFTISRDIKVQRNVGLASETAQLLVYDTETQKTVMYYPVNLTEGVVNSAYFYNEMLYYTVFYPFTGKRAVYLHDGLNVTELFSYQGEPVGMGESPVDLEIVEDWLFFVHKYETEAAYNKEYYLITGDSYEKFGIGFSAGVPFEHKVVKLESDIPLEDLESKEDMEIDFWIMEKTENERLFIKHTRDHKKVDIIWGPKYTYAPGDYYVMLEDAIIYMKGYSYARGLKKINIENVKLNASGTIGDFNLTGLHTDGEDFAVIRCDYASGYDAVVMNIDDENITLTKLDTGMDIVDIAVGDDNGLFLLKNSEGEKELYKLN